MKYTTITLVGALLIGGHATAMIKVIDTNKEGKLPKEIAATTLVSVFGSTPRYSAFRHCMSLLKEQLGQLDAAFKKSKRLKGVQKAIKQVMHRFKEDHPDESLAEHFCDLSAEDQFTLFFKIGFNHTILKENLARLCRCATKSIATKVNANEYLLIHILLPIYFDDCTEYEPSEETLHAFLKAVTCFYQECYEKVDERPEVIIYLPPLTYFDQMLTLAKKDEVTHEHKIKLLARVLHEELLPIKRSLPMVLINQNVDQLKALASELETIGSDMTKVRLFELQLMQGLQQTKSFTPYTLKLDETRQTKLVYTTSPLITEDLLNLLGAK